MDGVLDRLFQGDGLVGITGTPTGEQCRDIFMLRIAVNFKRMSISTGIGFACPHKTRTDQV
jgi:hypothetical protein